MLSGRTAGYDMTLASCLCSVPCSQVIAQSRAVPAMQTSGCRGVVVGLDVVVVVGDDECDHDGDVGSLLVFCGANDRRRRDSRGVVVNFIFIFLFLLFLFFIISSSSFSSLPKTIFVHLPFSLNFCAADHHHSRFIKRN